MNADWRERSMLRRNFCRRRKQVKRRCEPRRRRCACLHRHTMPKPIRIGQRALPAGLRRWENQQIEGEDVIILYHCAAARSFRPLWTLEELGLPYDLRMLPFPPRVLAREYLALNPLGTIPLLVDGNTRMTESAAISQYLVTRYGPTPLAG